MDVVKLIDLNCGPSKSGDFFYIVTASSGVTYRSYTLSRFIGVCGFEKMIVSKLMNHTQSESSGYGIFYVQFGQPSKFIMTYSHFPQRLVVELI